MISGRRTDVAACLPRLRSLVAFLICKIQVHFNMTAQVMLRIYSLTLWEFERWEMEHIYCNEYPNFNELIFFIPPLPHPSPLYILQSLIPSLTLLPSFPLSIISFPSVLFLFQYSLPSPFPSTLPSLSPLSSPSSLHSPPSLPLLRFSWSLKQCNATIENNNQ